MSHAVPPEPGHSSAERSSLSVRSLSGEPQTPEEIEAEIEVQREQLAETGSVFTVFVPARVEEGRTDGAIKSSRAPDR